MYTKLNISDHMLKQNKRWSHQIDRLDRVWNCIAAEPARNWRGERMSRVLKMQEAKRARMGIAMAVLITGVE